MSYTIKRKWSSYDEGHVNRWGDNEGSRFEAKKFDTREEAEREKRNLTWKLNGLSEDFEITDRY